MIRLDSATYVHAKEGCYRCGKAGPIVDLEVDIEGEGALALCDGCIFDAATAAGFECGESVRPQLEVAQDRIVQLEAQLDRAQSALAASVSAAAERLRDTRNER